MCNEIIFIYEVSQESGYEAHAQGYAIYTYADSFDELKLMVDDAVTCYFEEDKRPLRVILKKNE